MIHLRQSFSSQNSKLNIKKHNKLLSLVINARYEGSDINIKGMKVNQNSARNCN